MNLEIKAIAFEEALDQQSLPQSALILGSATSLEPKVSIS